MTLQKFTLTAICILSFVLNSFAQQATETKKPETSGALPPEIKEKAVNFLRRTAKDAATLNLAENRLAFLIATADLLWDYDENSAREAFKFAENDVRQMMTAQMQKAMLAASESDELAFIDAFTTGDGSMMDVQSIVNLRESLVLAIGKHDGEAAYRFLMDTRQPAPAKDEKQKSRYTQQMSQLPTAEDYRETSLEMRLARVIADNDPQKALEIGLKRLSVGLSEDLVQFAVKLYFKDKTRGAELAKEITRKLKNQDFTTDDSALSVAINTFKNGVGSVARSEKDREMSKTPFLSESDVRELAGALAKSGLKMTEQTGERHYNLSRIEELLPQLEKYAAAPATQLKLKLNKNNTAEVKSVRNEDSEFQRYMERAKKEEQIADELKKTVESAKGEFSLQGARTALSLIKNRTAKLTAMSQLAITLAENGKIEDAKELINEARKTLAAEPKFWAQYVEHLMVARAYASVDAKQSLEMLENLIYRIDDMLGGISKIAEFIAGETAVKENELRLSGIPGMIGGNLFSQMGRGNGMRDFTTGFEKDFMKLAKADFDRTAALADKFSKPEVRLMARMILINSFLPQKQETEYFQISADEQPDTIRRGRSTTVIVDAPPQPEPQN